MKRARHTAPALVAITLVGCAVLLGASIASATFEFTFETEKQIKTGPSGFDYVKAHCVVTNTGTDADSYDIYKDDTESPVTWQVSICVGGEDGTCEAPFVYETFDRIPLNPGESDTVSIYFTPVDEGSGYALLTVASHNDPGFEQALTLGCVTTGLDLVIVNDDEDPDYEGYFAAAVPVGLASGTWRTSLRHFAHDDLGGVNVAYWFTGDATSTLDATDREDLDGFLAAGGRLMLTGQEIAYDLCDPASPNWSAESQAWFENRLNATYVGDDAGTTTLEPVAGDPVADGLTLEASGGDGANNQTDPDVVAPALGGFGAWTYQGGAGTAAVRVEGGFYRAVFLGFGFEAISSATDREVVAFRVYDYLDDPLIGIGDQGVGGVVGPAVLARPRPNPFNPDVTVDFAIEAAGPVALRVVDASGRTVRTLVDDVLDAGSHIRHWDGRDDAGHDMASGVYFIDLRAAGQELTRKVVLAK